MGLNGVRIISIPVADQDRAKEFYCKVLDADVVSDVQIGPNMRWVELALFDGFPHLSLVTWFNEFKPGSLTGLVLESSQLEALKAKLNELGVENNGIESAPWGKYITIKDIDGNGIILQSSAD